LTLTSYTHNHTHKKKIRWSVVLNTLCASFILINTSLWLFDCMVDRYLAICCEKCEVRTYSTLKISLKAPSVLHGRPTCHIHISCNMPRIRAHWYLRCSTWFDGCVRSWIIERYSKYEEWGVDSTLAFIFYFQPTT
jgi:hypothetical protein